jgi:peptide/nickel transport system substrate-binding protein
MKNPFASARTIFLSAILLPALAACQTSSDLRTNASASLSAQAPTPTNYTERSLTICMGEEPQSLFLYGEIDLASRTVLEAVYDGPIDSLNYSYSPVILEQVPTLKNSGAVLGQVTVNKGDKIINDQGAIANLVPNIKYRPAGCTDPTCVATYTSGSVTMDQLVVTFKLKSGLLWSDGEPLTAEDSIYSYEVSKSPDIPMPTGMMRAILETKSYEKVDDLTVRWTGLPGNLDPSYSTRFWVPLPKHLWEGTSPAGLMTAEMSSRMPIGWGPYIIESWTAGSEIVLKKNPYYFRADEGLPHFDTLHIRFISSEGRLGVSALLSGECDVVDMTVRLDDQITELVDLKNRDQLQASFTTGTSWEHLDFNLQPASGYGQAYFQDYRLREAVAYCLDRQQVVDSALGGLSVVPDTYLPPQHPLFNSNVAKYPFDIEKGQALLEAIGWKDLDNNSATPRTAAGVAGVENGTPLLLHSTMIYSELRSKSAGILGASLLKCGIGYVAEYGKNSMFVENVDGLVFGRQFDTVQFGWISGVEPACELYTTDEIPDADNGWSGLNPTGFSNKDYDTACDLAKRALPGDAAYAQNHNLAQQLFAQYLPSIPLYLTVKTAIARADLTGLALDPTAATGLWNLEEYDLPQT